MSIAQFERITENLTIATNCVDADIKIEHVEGGFIAYTVFGVAASSKCFDDLVSKLEAKFTWSINLAEI